MEGLDLTGAASTREAYRWWPGRNAPLRSCDSPCNEPLWQFGGLKPSVAVFDFGVKRNILRSLEGAGFEVLVIPGSTDAETVRILAPDSILLSNGPGDPGAASFAVQTISALLDYRPLFGICLGHQILALALGGRTYKLKFGHRGGNQPVKHLATGKVEITSQNHGFAVDPDSLNPQEVEHTHINLNDGTLEGFRHRRLPLMAVQYHPEASPGPHDADHLFEEFRAMIVKSDVSPN
jgi:carbamoyl-phosphate synthase small subunit